jgi:ankyrin repeat protein
LIYATFLGDTAMVRCLIELGARIGVVESSGYTAFLSSAQFGHQSTMQYLLEEGGANMEDVDNNGMNVWDILTALRRGATRL